MRAWMADVSPAPSMIVVLSLSTVTVLAVPSSPIETLSRSMPRSFVKTFPPVRMPMSWSIALRRSP